MTEYEIRGGEIIGLAKMLVLRSYNIIMTISKAKMDKVGVNI